MHLTLEEGRCKGHPSRASIPARDPPFVNLSTLLTKKFRLVLVSRNSREFQGKEDHTDDSKRKFEGRICRQQDLQVMGSLIQSSVVRENCFKLIKSKENLIKPTLRMKMPGPKCSNRLVIYYHPSSSKDPLYDYKKRNEAQSIQCLEEIQLVLSRTMVSICITPSSPEYELLLAISPLSRSARNSDSNSPRCFPILKNSIKYHPHEGNKDCVALKSTKQQSRKND